MAQSLTTPSTPFRLGSPTNLTLGNQVTTDRPIRFSDSEPALLATESFLLGAPENYYHFVPLHSTSGGTTNHRFVGWRKCSEVLGLWVPTLLGQVTMTAHTVGLAVIGTTTLYPPITLVANLNSTNLRILNGTSYACPGGVIVDCLGNSHIEVCTTGANGTFANLLAAPF